MAIETRKEYLVSGGQYVEREIKEVAINGVTHVVESKDSESRPLTESQQILATKIKKNALALSYHTAETIKLQDQVIALLKAAGDNTELGKVLDKYTLEMQTLVEQFELKIDYLQTEKGKLP